MPKGYSAGAGGYKKGGGSTAKGGKRMDAGVATLRKEGVATGRQDSSKLGGKKK